MFHRFVSIEDFIGKWHGEMIWTLEEGCWNKKNDFFLKSLEHCDNIPTSGTKQYIQF